MIALCLQGSSHCVKDALFVPVYNAQPHHKTCAICKCMRERER